MGKIILIILAASVRSSILILIILFIKALFKKILIPKFHYYIWILLLISLAMPIVPSSAMSIYNIPKIIYENRIDKEQIQTTTDEKINDLGTNYKIIQYNNYFKVVNTDDTKYKILFFIWLAGFLGLGSLTIYNQFSFYKVVRNEPTIKDNKLRQILKAQKEKLGIKSRIDIKESRIISTPCLFGYKNPYVVIPQNLIGYLDEDKVKVVILHELCHCKRKDTIINFITMILQIFHWFNPIIWIGFNKMRSDMEVACDELVLKNLNKENHIFYGKTIIELLEVCSKPKKLTIMTNIVEDKIELKRRIIMIRNFKNHSIKFTLIGFLIIILVGCSTISQASNGIQKNDDLSKEQQEIDNQEVLEKKILDYNYYAEGTKDGSEKIIDKLDGVKVNVPINMYYDDPYAKPPIYIHLKKGEQVLNEEQAAQFFRFRKKQ